MQSRKQGREMHAKKQKVATHEFVWSRGLSRLRSLRRTGPAKAGTPNTPRFMVTIHARKRVSATHELVRSPGFSRSGPLRGCPPAKAGTPNTPRLMVTIHARKRVWALHEPRTSNLEPRTSNARRVSGRRGTFSEFDVLCSMFDVFP